MKKIAQFIFVPILILGASCLFSCEKRGSGLPVDGDGNEYDTVIIGTQVWLKDNLKTTKFSSGGPIHLETDPSKWYSVSLPAYCWYDNDEGLKDTYGVLYNWRAARLGTLCPKGWHTPTIEEWTTMINYLGGEEVAGGKLKETGTTHWVSNVGATNETGFTALPGGERGWNGTYNNRGLYSTWWTSSPSYDDTAWKVFVQWGGPEIGNVRFPSEAGFSVRCVKDNW